MTKRIKILYFHNKAEISGGERSLLNLWENMDTTKFKIIALLPNEGRFSQEAEKLGITIHYLSLPSLNILNSFKIIEALSQISKLIKQENIDIIHSYSPRNNIVSSLAGKLFKKPVIWHERNLLFNYEKDISKKHISLPKAIICNSKAVAERFASDGKMPDKIKVILNGVNIDKFNPSIDPSGIKTEFGLEGYQIVGLVSNLNKRKRAGYFLTLASIISRQNKNIKFIIVGSDFSDDDKKYCDKLKEKIVEFGIKDAVVFTGFRQDVNNIIAAFDVSVHVTLKEACSRAILESMAEGKPVIAVNDGGNPELIVNNETGFLVDNDEDSLINFANKIVEILNDKALREMIGTRARTCTEKYFDVKRNAVETENLYIELVNNYGKKT